MKVYFSHGKESGPRGTKIKKLASVAKSFKLDVESIDYRGIKKPDDRVKHLIDILKKEEDDIILVGSSMGGYVSLVASEHIKSKGIFLLAPALYINNYDVQNYTAPNVPVEIVHGWADETILVENSIKFGKKTNCTLHIIDGDHRLTSSIDTIEWLFKQFLEIVLNKYSIT